MMVKGPEFREAAKELTEWLDPALSLRAEFGAKGFDPADPEDDALKAKFNDKGAHPEKAEVIAQNWRVEALMGDESAAERGLLVNKSGLEKTRADAERKEKESTDTYIFLALLDQLQAQIDALQERIKDYNEQIEALQDVRDLIESGELDPMDPDHQRLLRAAGIPEEDWGTVTLEEIDKRIEGLKVKRDEAVERLDETRAIQNKVADVLANDPDAKSIDTTDMGLDEENAKKEAENPDYDPENATADDLRDLLDMKTLKNVSQRPDVQENEAAWFKAATADLKAFSSQEGYVDSMDRLIAELHEDTQKALLKDDEVLEEVKDRLRLDEFEKRYEGFQEFKDDPQYIEWLTKLILDKTDVRTRELLLQEEDTPEEVRKIITDNNAAADSPAQNFNPSNPD